MTGDDSTRDDVTHAEDGGALRLDTTALCKAHAALQSRVLRRAIETAGGEATQRHILDMMALIGGVPGKTLHLSGGLIFVDGLR